MGGVGGGRGDGLGAVSERDRVGGVGVDGGDRGCGVGVVLLVVAVGDLLGDLLSLAVGVGELVGVLERACELVACGGGFTERLLALVVEAGGEVGERLDAMLELADQRQAGVRELGACERGGLGGEAVEGEVEVLVAGVVAEQFGVDLEAGELRDGSRGPATDGPQLGRERGGRVGAVRVGAVVDGDREQVTAGVADVRECLVQRGELPLAGAGAFLACGDRGAQGVVSGLPVVMEQERTLSRLAEARCGSGSNRPGRGSGRNGGPACGEEEGSRSTRPESCFRLTTSLDGPRAAFGRGRHLVIEIVAIRESSRDARFVEPHIRAALHSWPLLAPTSNAATKIPGDRTSEKRARFPNAAPPPQDQITFSVEVRAVHSNWIVTRRFSARPAAVAFVATKCVRP